MNNQTKIKRTRFLAAILALLVLQPLANRASTTILNFDSVNASAGQVDATSYFASYGVTETSLVGGSAFSIVNQNDFYGTPGIVYASSPPNFVDPLSSQGAATAILLSFATPLTSLSFTRIEETGIGAGNSFGAWSAEVYSGATEIGSASESGYSIFNNSINPAQTYTFTGSDITSIEFDGSSEGFFGTQGILMDDFTMTTAVPEPTTIIAGVLLLLPFAASSIRVCRRLIRA
jgi:hypothetical protein